jgi:hypothetical protein
MNKRNPKMEKAMIGILDLATIVKTIEEIQEPIPETPGIGDEIILLIEEVLHVDMDINTSFIFILQYNCQWHTFGMSNLVTTTRTTQ